MASHARRLTRSLARTPSTYQDEDIPWVPYGPTFETMGFVTNLTGLGPLLEELKTKPIEFFEAREARVAAAIESHYSVKGVVEQITRFMNGGGKLGERGAGEGSDLQCRRMPETVRGHLNCSHYKGWC